MNTQSQMINPAETPLKRKRGRPRKDESLVQAEAIPPTPIVDNFKKNKQCADETTTAAVVGSDMVGQAVSGVIEGSFDAGYLLNVKVGNDDTHLRGVVFLPGKFTPLTASNDVAPEVKMCTRTEMPIPVQNPTIPVPSVQCGKQALEAQNFAPVLEVQVQGLNSQLQSSIPENQLGSSVVPLADKLPPNSCAGSSFGSSSASIMPQIGDNKVAEQNDLLKEFEASLAKAPVEQSKPMPPSVPIIEGSPERAVNLELQIKHQATDNELKPRLSDHGVESPSNIKSPIMAKTLEMSPEAIGIASLMNKPTSPIKPAPAELPMETISPNETSKLNGKPENHNAESAKSTTPVTLFEREVMASPPKLMMTMNQAQLCTDNMKIDSVPENLFERSDPPPPPPTSNSNNLVSDKPELQPQSCSSSGVGEGCDSTTRIVGDQMKIV